MTVERRAMLDERIGYLREYTFNGLDKIVADRICDKADRAKSIVSFGDSRTVSEGTPEPDAPKHKVSEPVSPLPSSLIEDDD